MLGKAWGWLTARLGSPRASRLRLSVHRHPTYPSFWRPSTLSDRPPHLEIQIYLEASNKANQPCWITAAEIDGMPAMETIIGVRDARTGKFAPDNPLPPRQIAVVSLHFLIEGQSPSGGEPFRAGLLLTDHIGEHHRVKVIMH